MSKKIKNQIAAHVDTNHKDTPVLLEFRIHFKCAFKEPSTLSYFESPDRKTCVGAP